jgi:subtilase family serine protease
MLISHSQGVQTLHEEGVLGAGVKIAVIDTGKFGLVYEGLL